LAEKNKEKEARVGVDLINILRTAFSCKSDMDSIYVVTDLFLLFVK